MTRVFRSVLGVCFTVCLGGWVVVGLGGCGAAPDDDELFGELDQLEQPMSAPFTPSFQMGTQTGSTRQRCNKTASGQVCVVPPNKSLRYCINRNLELNPFTDAEYTRIKSMITQIDGISGWTFTEVNAQQCFELPVDLVVIAGSVGSSGTASNDVKDYGLPRFVTVGGLDGGLVDMTESAGVVGQYQKWTVCRAIVDRVDILAKGTSTTQDDNGVDHAAAHAILGCLGMGGRTGDGGRASRNLFNPATTATVISSGESCTLAAFTSGTPTVWNNTGNCPSD
jgi:hypothetical protein